MNIVTEVGTFTVNKRYNFMKGPDHIATPKNVLPHPSSIYLRGVETPKNWYKPTLFYCSHLFQGSV